MKSYLCLILAVECLGFQQLNVWTDWTANNLEVESYPTDFGNPDIDARIQRPCEVYDTFCIRSFLAEHSYCKKAYGPAPDPLFRPQGTVNAMNSNISVTWQNLQYSGLNDGRVEEFYINKATDKLVIAVYLNFVRVTSAATHIKLYRRRQEPAVGVDNTAIDYRGVSHTVVIPHIDNLKLENAEIFSYLENPASPFAIGPGLTTPLASDPSLAVQYASYFATVPTGLREAFLTEGPFQVANYIQYNLCDFGLKVL